MAKTKHTEITVADDLVMSQIYVVRKHKVALDRVLAVLYGVTTGNLNKAVNRNIKWFHVPVI